VLLDESGFMLQPVRRRTWAPRGQTPIQYSWDRRDRLSVVAAVTLAPRRRRFGVHFRIHGHNLTADDLVAFLGYLRRHLRRKLLLVWDRWSVHRAAAPRLLQRYGPALAFEWLPPYAPDLNPAEQVWNHAKYVELANFIPRDVADLEQAVGDSIQLQHYNASLVASFFKLAKLEC
jgi:transposase